MQNILRTVFALMCVGFVSSFAFAQRDLNVMPTYTNELVADAATRPSLNGASDQFKFGGVLQARYSYRNVNGTPNQDTYGFELPMVRLDFSGNINDVFSYRISPKVSSNGDFTLEDAFINAHILDSDLTVGQFRPQFMSELNVRDEFEMTAYRSVIAQTLGQTYTQGVQMTHTFDDTVRLDGSFNDGVNMSNTAINVQNNSYAVTGRVQGSVWNHLSDKSNFVLGTGVNVEDQIQEFTVDGKLNYNQFSAGLAYTYARTNDTAVYTASRYQSLVGDLSYNVTEVFQPYIRQEFGHSNSGPNLNITHLGVNYYLVPGLVKWTNEVGFAYGKTSNAWNYDNTGFVSSNRDNQVVLTTQLQLLF